MRKYENVIIPESIKLLTIDNKYNLPIMSAIGRNNGLGDFKFISDPRKIALSAYELCSICGQPLSGEFSTILGIENESRDENFCHPKTIETTEAPAHVECLVYASLVCPFLLSPKSRYTKGERKGLKKNEGIDNPMSYIHIFEKCIPKLVIDNKRIAVGFTYSISKKTLLLNNEFNDRSDQLEKIISESPNRICTDARAYIIDLMNNGQVDYSVEARKFSNLLGSGFISGYDKIYKKGKSDRQSAVFFRKNIDKIANEEYNNISKDITLVESRALKCSADWLLNLNGNLPICVENWWRAMDKSGLAKKKKSKYGNPAKR